MENEPDYKKVVYIDEYPELKRRCWLRRLNAMRQIGIITIGGDDADLIKFPDPDEPA